jgi:hypothetical protein
MGDQLRDPWWNLGLLDPHKTYADSPFHVHCRNDRDIVSFVAAPGE